MKIAVLGGTFNPVHIGHLFLASEVRYLLGYDKIIFVPSNIPAHKQLEGNVTAEQRVEMLVAAVADEDGFVVDTCEIKRGGVSYTIDTIHYLEEKYKPQARVGIIIGDDLVAGFHKWKKYKSLIEAAEIIVARREKERHTPGFPSVPVDNAVLPVSSSGIRARIAEGAPYRYLLPYEVYRYITEKGLYIKRRD